jgi:hypothetical protein
MGFKTPSPEEKRWIVTMRKRQAGPLFSRGAGTAR